MKKIYHILGSDIPHHNNTVLQFFAEQLKRRIPTQAMAKFLVVGSGFIEKYPQLAIQQFNSKTAIALALIKLAKQDPNIHFYLHGQFNFPVWLAILFNLLPPERLTWQIWGADLYEDSNRLIFKLAYPLRRFIQKKLRHVTGTLGDLKVFSGLNPNAERTLIYFPTKMNRSFQPQPHKANERLTILVGNSGDHSNRHQEALHQIKQQLGENVRIIIPMGYPAHNESYIAALKTTAQQLFPVQDGKSAVEIIEEKLSFDDYLTLLTQCDLGYFIFQRQQGIGTVCLLTQLNIPVVLHQENAFTEDMRVYQVPFLLVNELNREQIEKTKQKLTALDKESIGFFDPYFINTWPPVLNKILASEISAL